MYEHTAARVRFNSRQGRPARIFVAVVTVGAMFAGVLAVGSAAIGF